MWFTTVFSLADKQRDLENIQIDDWSKFYATCQLTMVQSYSNCAIIPSKHIQNTTSWNIEVKKKAHNMKITFQIVCISFISYLHSKVVCCQKVNKLVTESSKVEFLTIE